MCTLRALRCSFRPLSRGFRAFGKRAQGLPYVLFAGLLEGVWKEILCGNGVLDTVVCGGRGLAIGGGTVLCKRDTAGWRQRGAFIVLRVSVRARVSGKGRCGGLVEAEEGPPNARLSREPLDSRAWSTKQVEFHWVADVGGFVPEIERL